MRRGIPALLLFLTLSLTTTVHAAPVEDSALDSLSNDKADTVFENAPDHVFSNATDEATSISIRGTYDYTGTVGSNGLVITRDAYPDHVAPAEDSAQGGVSEDRTDTVFENVPDNMSSNATDEATSISVRGTYNYTDTVGNSGLVTTNDAYLKAYPKDGECGLRVNTPHASNTYSEEIHTRIESFCKVLPLVSNTISGKTYRSRWYGWQRVATLAAQTVSAPSTRVQNYRRTAVAKCKAGDWYRYRTEGFGTISTGVQSFSAAAYEQNDDEIQCQKR